MQQLIPDTDSKNCDNLALLLRGWTKYGRPLSEILKT